MSFLQELNNKVNQVRGDIKRNAIESFIIFLKREMTEHAEQGLREGCIHNDNLYCELSETELNRLETILESERKCDRNISVIKWLLDNTTDVFKGINIEYTVDCFENDCGDLVKNESIYYHWYESEEA
jgi:hypothetical protein